jgi:hypothetical protein
MECHCYDKGLVPFKCTEPGEPSGYRWACQVSGLTPDAITDKYLPAVASAVHMGNVRKIELVKSIEGNDWTVILYAVAGNCATQVADYLFQTD